LASTLLASNLILLYNKTKYSGQGLTAAAAFSANRLLSHSREISVTCSWITDGPTYLDRLHIARAPMQQLASCCMPHSSAAWPCHKAVGPLPESTSRTHTPALALTVSVCCSQSCWSEVCLPAISVKCHIYARYLLCVCGVSLHACQETGLLSMQCRDGLHLNLCRVWNVQSIQVKRSAEMITIIMQAVRMLKSSASKLLCTLYWLHTMYHTACLPH